MSKNNLISLTCLAASQVVLFLAFKNPIQKFLHTLRMRVTARAFWYAVDKMFPAVLILRDEDDDILAICMGRKDPVELMATISEMLQANVAPPAPEDT